MVDPDILRVIEKINLKIASLQETRRKLAEEFGVDIDFTEPRVTSAGGKVKAVAPKDNSNRKATLAALIRERGPMPRVEILHKGGMPEGTVSYCLRDKSYFKQLEDGRWDVVDREQSELTLTAVS